MKQKSALIVDFIVSQAKPKEKFNRSIYISSKHFADISTHLYETRLHIVRLRPSHMIKFEASAV